MNNKDLSKILFALVKVFGEKVGEELFKKLLKHIL